MLVTVRTKRFKNMLSFRFYDIFFILVFSFLSVGVVRKVWCIKTSPPPRRGNNNFYNVHNILLLTRTVKAYLLSMFEGNVDLLQS